MNATHALGWALVHFLWQGTALAVILGVALALTRPTAARTRYTLSILTLAAMLLLPVATALRMHQSPFAAGDAAAPSPPQVAPTFPGSQPVGVRSATSAEMTARPTARVARLTEMKALVDPALPWLVVVWVGGVLVLSVRLGHGWIAARRLRTYGTRPTSASLHQMLARLAARLRVTRPVQLLESLIVEVPAVIGALRPVILVPASAITGLTPQQLEVLLAHELAHVRRYDYLVNVIQCVIETLLFYHPAVWWVSRRVRDEREHCCDDLVVQICGDPHLYASALVGMERIRSATPRLALAATGGSLLHRIRRLLLPAAARPEFFPRWAAGVAGVVAVTVALLATGSDRVSGEPADIAAPTDTIRTAPDTVLRHPDPSQPLAQRWDWAKNQARQLGRRTYWIGYQVSRPAWLEHSVYVDRGSEVTGPGVRISGRMLGNFQGFLFRGVRLAPLTRAGDSDDIAILFGFSADASGKVTLTRVHVASFYLPMDFRGRTLFWLGDAADTQSLPIVEALFAATAQPELREDIVSAIGVHGSSDLVIPILLRLLASRESTDVRVQAAEWLGFHPTAAAVVALTAAARNDQAGDVRRQAAEALAENTLPAATDSTIAVAKTAGDPDTRRAAVEGLGQKDSERALATLVSIAQSDRDEDVQRAAVEALGEMPSGRGLTVVRDIARSHSRPDVRRAAVETLGDRVPTAETARFLSTLAVSDRDEDVSRGAIEALGEMGDLGLPAVIEMARTHPSADVRRAAIETIGDKAPTTQALDLLAQFAQQDHDPDVQRAAVEQLGDMRDARARAMVARIARGSGNVDVRRAAIEKYGESAPSDSTLALLKSILASDAPEDVYSAVLEALEEMEGGAGIPALIDAARSHPNRDVRADALRRLAESDDPRAQQVFEQTLRRP
jgi:HEAT repeat protein/beta-lactamase regulating signal transducer with metallopeptidase domain